MADHSQTDIDQLRRDVATANRSAYKVGLVNAFGHISARIPGTDTFLFPTRASPALADAGRLLTLDTEGTILAGEGNPNTEFWIHARIYAARPDVGAVGHVHSPKCVSLGQIGQTVRVMHNTGAPFAEGVPVFEKIGLIRSRQLGDDVAATLGRKRAMLLRGHGANVADANVRYVAALVFFLEEAAELQLQALAAAGGDPERIRFFTEQELGVTRAQIDDPGPLDRAWEYLQALVDGRI